MGRVLFVYHDFIEGLATQYREASFSIAHSLKAGGHRSHQLTEKGSAMLDLFEFSFDGGSEILQSIGALGDLLVLLIYYFGKILLLFFNSKNISSS